MNFQAILTFSAAPENNVFIMRTDAVTAGDQSIHSHLFTSVRFLSSDRWMDHVRRRLAFKNNSALNSLKAPTFNNIQLRWSIEMKFCCKKWKSLWHEGKKRYAV